MIYALIFKQQEAMQEAGWSANFIENHDQPRATTKYLKNRLNSQMRLKHSAPCISFKGHAFYLPRTKIRNDQF